jgi:hypothetical protein
MPKVANITISGFGTFENNGYDGLYLNSTGLVNIANLTANNNYTDGAYVETGGDLAPQSVTLSGVNRFFHNGFGSGSGDGLQVSNDGTITISNLSAINNWVDGTYLDNISNAFFGKFLGVTLTGVNSFEQNQGSYGLYIHTDGSATMSHVNADENVGDGVNVTATKNVTLLCASAFSNGNDGINLTGTIMTLTGVHAYYNSTNEALSYTTLHRTGICP